MRPERGGGGGGGGSGGGEYKEKDCEERQQLEQKLVIAREAGKAVTRVVIRCNQAKETYSLDLGGCELMGVPDGVFLLLQNTELTSCDLSRNHLSKIPPKLPIQFFHLKNLNLSRNRLCKLPEEFIKLESLEELNISHNGFVSFPSRLLSALPNLLIVNAERNQIAGLEVIGLRVKRLNLRQNPLNEDCIRELSSLTHLLTLLITLPDPQ